MDKKDEALSITRMLEDSQYRRYFASEFCCMRELLNDIPNVIAREVEAATKYTIARLEHNKRIKETPDEREEVMTTKAKKKLAREVERLEERVIKLAGERAESDKQLEYTQRHRDKWKKIAREKREANRIRVRMYNSLFNLLEKRVAEVEAENKRLREGLEEVLEASSDGTREDIWRAAEQALEYRGIRIEIDSSLPDGIIQLNSKTLGGDGE